MLRLFRKRKSCTSSDRSVSAAWAAEEPPGAGRGMASSSTSAMARRAFCEFRKRNIGNSDVGEEVIDLQEHLQSKITTIKNGGGWFAAADLSGPAGSSLFCRGTREYCNLNFICCLYRYIQDLLSCVVCLCWGF